MTSRRLPGDHKRTRFAGLLERGLIALMCPLDSPGIRRRNVLFPNAFASVSIDEQTCVTLKGNVRTEILGQQFGSDAKEKASLTLIA
jgi:hypothetical protein